MTETDRSSDESPTQAALRRWREAGEAAASLAEDQGQRVEAGREPTDDELAGDGDDLPREARANAWGEGWDAYARTIVAPESVPAPAVPAPQPTPAEQRAAARRAAKAQAEQCAARRAELIRQAAEQLAAHRAGVDDAKLSTAMETAARATALGKLGARARDLLERVAGTTAAKAVRLGAREWTRQRDRFLRSSDELEVGPYACGRQNKPRDTQRAYILLLVANRAGVPIVLDIGTSSEAAGDEAARAVAEVWREVEAAADVIEAAEEQADEGESVELVAARAEVARLEAELAAARGRLVTLEAQS